MIFKNILKLFIQYIKNRLHKKKLHKSFIRYISEFIHLRFQENTKIIHLNHETFAIHSPLNQL